LLTLKIEPRILAFFRKNPWSVPEKGHDDLLRALHLVAAHLPEMWQLLLPGRDVEGSAAKLQNLTEELGLAQHVRLLGPRMDVPPILSAADIYVCPSRREGLPNNLLEAMCVGLPVVATNIGGIPELVENGQSGLLVPPADPPRLGEALRLLALDSDRRASLGSAAAARVRGGFSIEGYVAAYQTIFSELASRGVK
jgi:glycosyltransferase involved in cell wall biosynthesis